jgi:hypothetical protein
MFQDCYLLTAFNANLSSLTTGNYMFYRAGHDSGFESFASDLSSLTSAYEMFFGCVNLTSFNSNLSSLTNGEGMFEFCYKLMTFTSDLSKLTKGKFMFNQCKLDASSVKNIIDTINTYSGVLWLGMGCDKTTEDKDLFAQEVGYADMTSLLAALQAKGWTVTAQYTGRPTTTYSLRRPSEDTLPVFVKFEEVDGEIITINQATHINEDGSMSYRLTWFHETTGSTDGYTQFNSLEDAIESLNIKPIEN